MTDFTVNYTRVKSILSFELKTDDNRIGYNVHVVYIDDTEWAGWVDIETFELIKEAELKNELSDLNNQIDARPIPIEDRKKFNPDERLKDKPAGFSDEQWLKLKKADEERIKIEEQGCDITAVMEFTYRHHKEGQGICAHCMSWYDDNGDIIRPMTGDEQEVSKHTLAKTSHGMCNTCKDLQIG